MRRSAVGLPGGKLDQLKRRRLNVCVSKAPEDAEGAKILATVLKRMEGSPELSVEDAFANVIAEVSGGDPLVAAKLGMRLGEYREEIEKGHGASYIDLDVRTQEDVDPQIEAALSADLEAILGENRVLLSRIVNIDEDLDDDAFLNRHTDGSIG